MRVLVFTARRSYANAVLGVVILSVCLSVRLSVCLSHVCFVTNPKKLPTIFLYHFSATQVFFFVCLSVCSSRFWTSVIVRLISPWSRWSTETILIPLDRGRFVVVHPCSTFSDCCQLATPLNAEIQKTAKIVFFCRHKPIETKFGT